MKVNFSTVCGVAVGLLIGGVVVVEVVRYNSPNIALGAAFVAAVGLAAITAWRAKR